MVNAKTNNWVIVFYCFITFIASMSPLSANAQDDESLESQVTEILADEAPKGKIKVGVLDFVVTDTRGTRLSKEEQKDLGAEANERLVADVLKVLRTRVLKEKYHL